MQPLLQFIAAWLFPGAACDTAEVAGKATIAESSELDNASSSPAFSVKAADSGSSMPSSSSSSSLSDDDHPRFFTPRREQSPPSSPLCFGAGGGAGRLMLWGSRGARARSRTKQEAAAASVAPAKADVVGRYLRKISRRLRKSRTHTGSPSPGRALDDTDRERSESVARAVSFCKGTLRRGAAPPPPPRPAPSPSLDDWLHGRQDEIIASAAAYCNGQSTGSQSQPPPHRGGGLAVTQAMAKRREESTCPPSPCRDASVAVSDVPDGKESPHHGHGAIDKRSGESVTAAETAMSSSSSELVADEMEMANSFDEMNFLKIFHGDEETIGHHFITLHLYI